MILQTGAIIEELSKYLAQNPRQVAAIVAVVVGVVAHYMKTGKLPLGRLPWRYFRKMLRDITDKYFGVKRPRGVVGLVADAPPEHIMERLRERHYESVDLYSYEYSGEVFSFRRPSGQKRNNKTGELVPMETHPRGFKTSDDRTLIICHDEASRFEATGVHLAESMLSWERGRDIIKEDLQALSISYEEIESEAGAEIEVVS